LFPIAEIVQEQHNPDTGEISFLNKHLVEKFIYKKYCFCPMGIVAKKIK
jgi:hypothetical protein